MKKLLLSINILLILIFLILVRYLKTINENTTPTATTTATHERVRKNANSIDTILNSGNELDTPSLTLFQFETAVENLTVNGSLAVPILTVTFEAYLDQVVENDFYNTTITNFSVNIAYTYNGEGTSQSFSFLTDNNITEYDFSNIKSIAVRFNSIVHYRYYLVISLSITITSTENGALYYQNIISQSYNFNYNDLGILPGNIDSYNLIGNNNIYYYDYDFLISILNFYAIQAEDYGYSLAKDYWYNYGLADGENGFSFNWLTALFDTTNKILNVEIIQGFKLWYIIGLPALFSLVYMILKLFR